MDLKLAFIGFGVVGQGLAEILTRKKGTGDPHLTEFRAVAISDNVKGSIYNPEGLDLGKALEMIRTSGNLAGYDAPEKGWDAVRTIRESNADVILEATFTDIETAEPAMAHFRAALESGKHLATTNKGPTTLALREMIALAEANKVQFRYEGTVMAGTPVLNLAHRFLAGNEFARVRGIFNGTTNFILTRMETGMTYADALQEAQDLGYAEAVPDADVEGWDALAKVVILANAVMGANLRVADVDRTGITGITPENIQQATSEGKRWKLIGEIRREGGQVVGKVSPEKVDLTDPLASVGGATNAITFSTDLIQDVTVVGPGAGKIETGFALFSDLVEIHRSLH
ncbi:MAG: homoserine dehydrogenase [Candidatus Eisenbacteria sp.]|nr:homoserine dehydrogenase [Candidatus Eisenbacteria bacterium]